MKLYIDHWKKKKPILGLDLSEEEIDSLSDEIYIKHARPYYFSSVTDEEILEDRLLLKKQEKEYYKKYRSKRNKKRR